MIYTKYPYSNNKWTKFFLILINKRGALYFYIKGSDYISLDQATNAEGKMIISELRGDYSYIYNQWKSDNPITDTPLAAYNAGHILTMKYEVPNDTSNQAKIRGRTANDMYIIMTS